MHTAMVVSHAIEADLVAIHIDQADRKAAPIVYGCRTKTDGITEPFIEPQGWSECLEKLIQLEARPSADESVIRLTPQGIEERTALQRIAQPLVELGGLVDAVKLRFPLNDHQTCHILYLRFGDRTPFGGNNIWMLKHLSELIKSNTCSAYDEFNRAQTWREASVLGPIPLRRVREQDLLSRLSTTERVVLDHLRRWGTEKQIAEVMDRSPNTIHVHVKSIYRKLMVTSRRQLLAFLPPSGQAGPAKGSIESCA